MTDHIIFEPGWRPGAALIRLNRPDKSNALTARSVRMFLTCLQDAEDDPATRCVVIRGSERMFSGGADLEEISHDDPAVAYRLINLWTRLFMALRMSVLPVITVVEGPCVGGGYHLNLAADYCLATDRAWFRHTGVDAGIAPMLPGTMLAASVVGLKRATRNILWPRKILAAEALQIGLCSEVTAAEELERVLDERVAELVGRDPMTVALAKAEINAATAGSMTSAVLSQLAGFLHARMPEAHAKMQSYAQSLGTKS
jgi:enoyl-CoA hydratase/carnithine racemase